MTTMKSGVDSFSSPNEFLGGCGAQKSRAPRRSLRASWVQPAGEELSLESLGLGASKGGLDALLAKDNMHSSIVKDTPLMHDETEKTANSSVGDFDYSDSSDLHHDVVVEKVEEVAPVKEKRTSMAYALDDFLPGSEPKATKKWTPPKKEDDSSSSNNKAGHMAGAYAQDSFLPGCGPKPIKRWTPPPKEAPDSPTKRRSSLYDNQSDFIGGCEPKATRRWSKPKAVEDDDDAPTKRRSSLYDNQTDFIGGCEPKEQARRSSRK